MAQEPDDVLDRDDDDDIDAALDEADAVGGDTAEGGAGEDTTEGGGGNDNADEDIEVVLAAEDGEDEAEDDAGDETVEGAAGEDTVEGAAAADDDVGEELDDEARGYSKSVQKRILREKRLTRRVREEGQQLVLTERQKRLAAEKDLTETRESLAEVVATNLEQEIKAVQADLKKAMEEGETDKHIELQGKLDELRAQKRDVDNRKAAITKAKEDFEERSKQELAAVQQQREIPPDAQAWLDRNRWLKSPHFKAEALFVRAVDNRLGAEFKAAGKAIGDAAYFRELDRRVARELPDLKRKVAQVFRQQPGGKPRSALAPVARSARTPTVTKAAGKKKVVLNKADLENMANFKLDPNNAQHRLQYARSKAGLI